MCGVGMRRGTPETRTPGIRRNTGKLNATKRHGTHRPSLSLSLYYGACGGWEVQQLVSTKARNREWNGGIQDQFSAHKARNDLKCTPET